MLKIKNILWDKYFFITVPLLVIFIIHLFCTPTYILLSADCKISNDICNMQAKIDRKDHILESVKNIYDASTHMAKTEFRLTPPFFAKIFRIQTKSDMYLLQFIIGVLFFFLITKFTFQITNNKILTLLITLSFSFLYTGYSFFSELLGYFDCFAFFFLLISMFDISVFFIFISLFFAFWTDERAISSSFLIIFWWQYKQIKLTNKSFFLPSKQSISVILCIVSYFLFRIFLIKNFGLKNQLDGASMQVISDTIQFYNLTTWQMFEGFWIIILWAIIQLINDRKIITLLFFILGNLLMFISAMCVYDNTRSIAYAFPSILIATYIIKDYYDFKKLAAISLLICYLFPCYFYVCGVAVSRHDPIYIRFAKKLVHAKNI